MYQKVKRIITIVLIVAVLIGALLYFVPWPTRVNLVLNAAKLDKSGNSVGHSTITIKGVMYDYLFQKDSLSVSIYPFDDFAWVQLSDNLPENRKGVIQSHFQDCKKIYCSAWDSSLEDSVFCELLFTKDFKYIAFVSDTPETKTYYVASADNQVRFEDLAEYFHYLPPFG